MGTIAGIIASLAASHLGGMGIGTLFAKKGWFGFAGEAGKLVIKKRLERRAKQAATDHRNWLKENAKN
jgi:hypothetical protein